MQRLGSLASSARTILFVPGDRPDRFGKAASSGCDLAIADLEDAVPADRKGAARAEVARALQSGVLHAVRINGASTPWHGPDLAALAPTPCVVMLPKAEAPDHICAVMAALAPGSVVLALVETAAGVLAAPQLAATTGVVRLAFGSFDLAAELGVSPEDRDAMAAARSAVVLASAAARIAGPVDGVTGAIDDADALRSDVAHARRLGFTGKLCIHPRQVPIAAESFAPSESERRWAESILRAVEASTDGVVAVDGKMVDAPVISRARRILAARVEPTSGTTTTRGER